METIEPEDSLDEYNLHLASQIVDRLPLDLRSDMGALILIEKGIHTGVNAQGDRITPQDREILKKTKKELLRTMTSKYLENGEGDIDAFLVGRGFDNHYIQRCLQKEAESTI